MVKSKGKRDDIDAVFKVHELENTVPRPQLLSWVSYIASAIAVSVGSYALQPYVDLMNESKWLLSVSVANTIFLFTTYYFRATTEVKKVFQSREIKVDGSKGTTIQDKIDIHRRVDMKSLFYINLSYFSVFLILVARKNTTLEWCIIYSCFLTCSGVLTTSSISKW
jgi:hypothetical protein